MTNTSHIYLNGEVNKDSKYSIYIPFMKMTKHTNLYVLIVSVHHLPHKIFTMFILAYTQPCVT